MSLTLYYHPLSSFCWKTLIALYENGTPFTPQMVDLSNEAERAALLKIWPIGKFPVLRDSRERPHRSGIQHHHRIPRHALSRRHAIHSRATPNLALPIRLRDRFYDLYVHLPMQKIMGDRLRPADSRDPYGVAEAKARLQSCYGMIDTEVASRSWAMGEAFTLADCAAAPALFYGNMVVPFGAEHKNLAAFFERLKARPSFARVLKEAEPYFGMVPKEA